MHLGLSSLKEHAAEKDPLGTEGWIGWPVCTDDGWFRGGGKLLLLDVI